jgi:hypothetical protein
LNEQDEDWDIDVDSKWNLSPEEELLLNRYKGKWEETDKGLIVKGSLMLTNTKIKSLGRLYSVEGNLEIGHTLESLGNLTNVGRYLLLNFTKIKSLENLQFVGQSLYLFNSKIESLGNLKHVGSTLDLRNSKIESLGNLKYIGGNLDLRNTPLSKKYTEEQIRQIVNVKGKILGAKPSLNEILESENDWDVNVSDMWSDKELGIGDEITLDMVNKDNQNDYDYFLHNFGPRTFPILIGKSSAGEEYVTLKAVNSKSGKVREFPISWLNDRFLKPQYQVVPSLNEFENDWDVNVSDEWNVKDLGIGDYITPEMLNDNAFTKSWKELNDIKIIGFRNDFLIIEYIGSSGKIKQDNIDVEIFNQYFLKPQYRIVPSLDEYDTWNYV